MKTAARKGPPGLLSMLLAGLLLYPANSQGGEQCLPPPTTDAQCLDCHQEEVAQELTKPFVHQPFREKKCMLCHLGGELFTPEKTAYRSDLRVAWLVESPLSSVEHWLPLPKEQVRGDIYIDIKVPGHGVYRSVIDDLDLASLPELPLDRKPPELADIQVASIEKGALVSATITWVSDELADTRIAYGLGQLNKTAQLTEMRSSHQITIAGLKDATLYQYQVGSADYLGNLAQGPVMTFSTDNAVKPTSQYPPKSPGKEMTWEREAYQDSQSGLLILRISTSVPTEVAVGLLKKSAAPEAAEEAGGKKPVPCRHQLKGALETTINICLPCHEAYIKGGTRHPLLVKPKAGMKIPPEYFLLADGRISCMTCHSAHSSTYRYRLVKSGKEELCRSCHADK